MGDACAREGNGTITSGVMWLCAVLIVALLNERASLRPRLQASMHGCLAAQEKMSATILSLLKRGTVLKRLILALRRAPTVAWKHSLAAGPAPIASARANMRSPQSVEILAVAAFAGKAARQILGRPTVIPIIGFGFDSPELLFAFHTSHARLHRRDPISKRA